jgi:hypothetical protein
MSKYILVYEISDYPEMGGGIYAENFGMEENKMHKRVNELANKNKNNFSVVYAGFLQTEYKYQPVEMITEYRPERVP